MDSQLQQCYLPECLGKQGGHHIPLLRLHQILHIKEIGSTLLRTTPKFHPFYLAPLTLIEIFGYKLVGIFHYKSNSRKQSKIVEIAVILYSLK